MDESPQHDDVTGIVGSKYKTKLEIGGYMPSIGFSASREDLPNHFLGDDKCGLVSHKLTSRGDIASIRH